MFSDDILGDELEPGQVRHDPLWHGGLEPNPPILTADSMEVDGSTSRELAPAPPRTSRKRMAPEEMTQDQFKRSLIKLIERNKEEAARKEELEGPVTTTKRRKPRSNPVPSVFCQLAEAEGHGQACKQRAILGFKYCIRHILLDTNAPYVRCQHHRKPKTKKDTGTRCTNAIRVSTDVEVEKYCTTHMIMHGLKVAKRKNKPSSAEPEPGTALDPKPEMAEDLVKEEPGNVDSEAQSSTEQATTSMGTTLGGRCPAVEVQPVGEDALESRNLGGATQKPLLDVFHPRRPQHEEHDAVERVDDKQEVISNYEETHGEGHSDGHDVDEDDDEEYDGQVDGHDDVIGGGDDDDEDDDNDDEIVTAGDSDDDRVLSPRALQALEARHRKLSRRRLRLTAKFHRLQMRIFDDQPNSAQKMDVDQRLAMIRVSLEGLVRMHPVVLAKKLADQGMPFDLDVVANWREYMVDELAKLGEAKFPADLLRQFPSLGMKMRRENGVLSAEQRAFIDGILDEAMPEDAPLPRQGLTDHDVFDSGGEEEDADGDDEEEESAKNEEGDDETDENEENVVSGESDDDDDVQILEHSGPGPGIPEIVTIPQANHLRTMVGRYRLIPQVDRLCRVMEDQAFDRSQMYPLSLESASESDSDLDERLPVAPAVAPSKKDRRLHAYLLEKEQRQRCRSLQKKAQLVAPLLAAASEYPNAVSAAMLQSTRTTVAPYQRAPNTLRRCYYTERFPAESRCDRSCLPSANYCQRHILVSVDQRLFSYCKQTCCRRPVNFIDVLLWDGYCQQHRMSRVEKFGPYPVYEGDDEDEHWSSEVYSNSEGEFSESPLSSTDGSGSSSSDDGAGDESDDEDDDSDDDDDIDTSRSKIGSSCLDDWMFLVESSSDDDQDEEDVNDEDEDEDEEDEEEDEEGSAENSDEEEGETDRVEPMDLDVELGSATGSGKKCRQEASGSRRQLGGCDGPAQQKRTDKIVRHDAVEDDDGEQNAVVQMIDCYKEDDEMTNAVDDDEDDDRDESPPV